MRPNTPINADAAKLVPTAVLVFILKTDIIVGSRILPRTKPTKPPRNPIANPINDSIHIILFIVLFWLWVCSVLAFFELRINIYASYNTIMLIPTSNIGIGMYLVNNEPRKAPIAPVSPIIRKIRVFTFFCLKCWMDAIAAPIVLTPILVPAVAAIETSELKINGKRNTPSTNPTMPPTNPIANPTPDNSDNT